MKFAYKIAFACFAAYAASMVVKTSLSAVQREQAEVKAVEAAKVVAPAPAPEPAPQPVATPCYDPEKGLDPSLSTFDTPYCEGALEKLNAKLKAEQKAADDRIAEWGGRVVEAKRQHREYCWNYYDQNGFEDYAAGCGM